MLPATFDNSNPVRHATVGNEYDLHGILDVWVTPPVTSFAWDLFISRSGLLIGTA
jgi:hypothetical protein